MTILEYPDSHDLNFSNRPVRTRMPGGVAGAQSEMAASYADYQALGIEATAGGIKKLLV
ncbi:MAG: hypothetical protein IPN53_00865 [Comamonadaceae bacterium]|nr:hypothetical protein [Comamonadaceae bacterium]